MRTNLIRLFYRMCKAVGLFHLSRLLTRPTLRILCYHGFVLKDEDRFRKSLFITGEMFERRMRYLRNKNFPVLPFGEAVTRLRDGTLPPNAVTVTIDDGFFSVYQIAFRVLRQFRIPALLYVTSYYHRKGTPIFELAIAYMCWKSELNTVDLSDLGVPEFQAARNMPFDQSRRERIGQVIVEYGKSDLDEPGRIALSRRLAERLEVDYEAIAQSRILNLVNEREIRELEEGQVEIGLHTHRHRFPLDPDQARQELEDNRSAIEPLLGRTMTHFCYPSGDWSRNHWSVLDGCGVVTATTCDSGLAYADTPLYALPRILDDNRVSQIEFEAELYGFSELLRRLRRVPRYEGTVAVAKEPG